MNVEINRNQGMAVSDPKGAISDALRCMRGRSPTATFVPCTPSFFYIKF